MRVSRPDVVLMDIKMPGSNGIELSQRIKSKYPGVKILILTVFSDNDKILTRISISISSCDKIYILRFP